MRRSSWIALVLAVVLLLTAGALYRISSAQPAPPMTRRLGVEMLERGKRAVETSDADALMALFTDDAMILGRRPDDFRKVIEKAFSELKGNFRVETSHVEVETGSANAEIRFVMDLGQRDERMDAVYFPQVRMRAKLVKALTPRWLGLFHVEEWRVIELTSDPQIVPRPTET